MLSMQSMALAGVHASVTSMTPENDRNFSCIKVSKASPGTFSCIKVSKASPGSFGCMKFSKASPGTQTSRFGEPNYR